MTTTNPADETIVTIPWRELHDSPLQYRQTYSDATIAGAQMDEFEGAEA